jgi:hypothetical protein
MQHNREDLETVRSYINRLSDYLFILSCNLWFLLIIKTNYLQNLAF